MLHLDQNDMLYMVHIYQLVESLEVQKRLFFSLSFLFLAFYLKSLLLSIGEDHVHCLALAPVASFAMAPVSLSWFYKSEIYKLRSPLA